MMSRQRHLNRLLLWMLLIGLGCLGPRVLADDQTAANKFEVVPVFPASSTNQNTAYFNDHVTAGTTKSYTIQIENHATTQQTYRIAFNRAVTNVNGVVEYSQPNQDLADTNSPDLNQLVDRRVQEVTIGAQSAKKVTVKITLPAQTFEGILLGGFYVTRVNESNNQKTTTSTTAAAGVEFRQEFAYAIAVQLQEKIPYQDGESLKLTQIETKTNDGQPQFITEFKSEKPNLVRDVQVTIEITKKGEKKRVVKLVKDGIRFAPNSDFMLNFALPASGLPANRYTAKINVKTSENQYTFTKNFKVTQKQARTLAANDPATIQPKSTEWLKGVIAGLAVLVVILTSGIVVLWRKRNKKEEVK